MTTPAQTTWDDALAQAFSVLLGSPADADPGASFGAYYACHDLSLELFEEGFDAGLLARGEIVRPPFRSIEILGELFEGWDPIAPRWTVDLGRSIFVATEEGDHGVPGFGAGLTGRAFGRELAAQDLSPQDLCEAFPLVAFRVHSDGSLLNALSTITGADPDHLMAPPDGEAVEPERAAALAAVAHEGLRDHLRNLCLTEHWARSDGAFYLGAQDPSSGLLPSPVLAAWSFGEAQAWSAVTRLP